MYVNAFSLRSRDSLIIQSCHYAERYSII